MLFFEAMPYTDIEMAGDVPVIDIPEIVPFITEELPTWLPLADPLNTYTGSTPFPAWNDVWNWVSGRIIDLAPQVSPTSYVTWGDQERMHQATAGETIAALSYFLIQDEQSAIDVNNKMAVALAQTQLASVQTDIQVGNILVDMQAVTALNQVLAQQYAEGVGQVVQAQAQAYTDGVAAIDRQWAMDTIFKPLFENIGQAEAQATAQSDLVYSAIVPEATGVAQMVVAPVAAAVAVLAPAVTAVTAAVKTLTDQATNCVNDMCANMGPGSALGKFLKGLNIAGEAALLAELAALDGNGIQGVLSGLLNVAHGVIDDVDALFTGGENVGQLFAREASAII